MHIEPFFDERTSTLTYVVFDEATKEAAVIDPVLDYEPAGGKLWTESVERVAHFIDGHGLKPGWVLETHVHADHLSGSQWLKKRYGAKVAVSERITEVQAAFAPVFGLDGFVADGHPFDQLLADGQLLRIGGLTLEARATPGHTPACMSFVVGDAVFTGDALFLDDVGVGRCDFPKGSADALYDSVTRRIFTLPDATRIFAGHDYPPPGRGWKASTTVGQAKAANVQLKSSNTKEEFVARRTARDRTLTPPRLLYPSLQVNMIAGQLPEPRANGRRYLCTPIAGL
ncbi:MAG: MBL fold metallo-hydrolase [Myxococcaceae bacterium]|nr:MBL fold metallo-hydrolase [Myxococcaceae bacterium]